MMMLLSFNISFSLCLESLSRTRIPKFGPMSKPLKSRKGIYIDLLQILLAPLGHHQRKISPNHPIRMKVSWVVQPECQIKITLPWPEKKIGWNPSTDALSGCSASMECGQ